jgi:hypothetical protein
MQMIHAQIYAYMLAHTYIISSLFTQSIPTFHSIAAMGRLLTTQGEADEKARRREKKKGKSRTGIGGGGGGGGDGDGGDAYPGVAREFATEGGLDVVALVMQQSGADGALAEAAAFCLSRAFWPRRRREGLFPELTSVEHTLLVSGASDVFSTLSCIALFCTIMYCSFLVVRVC